MRVLVTGASGFIGSHIVAALLGRGHEVIAVSRDAARMEHCAWRSRVTWLPLNVEAGADHLFERAGKPDALIHAAWNKLEDYRHPAHFEVMATEHYHFIRELVAAGLNQCLVLGTCLEYGMLEGALHEELAAEPVLAYPLGKHLLRQMLRGLQMRREFSLQWVRLFYMYGPGQRSNSLLAQLDAALAAGRTSFDMSKGDQVRDYLSVTEVARTVGRIVELRDFNGIVNCCSGKPLTVRALVEQHLRERGATMTLNLGKYPYPDYEPHAFWGDRTRLDGLMGGPQ